MDPRLTYETVKVRVAERRRAASSTRIGTARSPRGDRHTAPAASVTVREVTPDDACELKRLADLDCSSVPALPALVAEVEGDLVAALPLQGGSAVSDPFRRTAAIVHLLELRATQVNSGPGYRPRRGLHRLLGRRSSRRPAQAAARA